ncbi:hypothetical protein SAMN05720487_1258 [Fibrobacter sp. UWT2]|nr:hypothetical protein SAMN05720487_1258 [Fibrobacter sp. UWT2]
MFQGSFFLWAGRVFYFWGMISEKDLAELEKIPYEQRIERVEKLLEGKNEPRAFELGLLLALKMGQEIREGKELGSDSGDLVASWSGKHPDSVVEEAIAFAKEFLMNPAGIAEKIKRGLQKQDADADSHQHDEQKQDADADLRQHDREGNEA